MFLLGISNKNFSPSVVSSSNLTNLPLGDGAPPVKDLSCRAFVMSRPSVRGSATDRGNDHHKSQQVKAAIYQRPRGRKSHIKRAMARILIPGRCSRQQLRG